MAITPPRTDIPSITTSHITGVAGVIAANSWNPIENVIQGEMFSVVDRVPWTHQINNGNMDSADFDSMMKEKLVTMLVKELMKSKFIEFTKEQLRVDEYLIYRARIFAVPDTQVRILRQNGLPK